MADWLSREEAKRLADRVLGFSRAEGCQVNLASTLEGNTRSAVDGVTTAGEVRDTSVTITSRFGKRSASVATNLLDEAALRRAVETGEQLARLAPENPEQMPLLASQRYQEVPALSQATVALNATARAEAAGITHGACVRAGLRGAGFIHRTAGASAVANSTGLFAYHAESEVSHTLSARTPAGDGAGWAGSSHSDWTRCLPAAALAERSIARALQSRGAAPLEPGRYTVILEPTAVANLLALLTSSLDARAADEGRSFFSRKGGGNRMGEKVVDDRVTILSDPGDPELLQPPFTSEGEPIGRTVWIENGVVRNLVYTRYWADKQGQASRPQGGGIRMSGTEATVDELIAQVDRGLLVTRFWYIRGVDPRTITHTGLTRDGVLLVENGKVTRAVQNFRFNESPITMLRNLVAMGRPERVTSSETGGLGGTTMVVPPIVTREFNFTSVSEAV